MKYKIIVKDYDNYYEKDIDTNDYHEKSDNAIIDAEINYMRKDFYKEHGSQPNEAEVIRL